MKIPNNMTINELWKWADKEAQNRAKARIEEEMKRK